MAAKNAKDDARFEDKQKALDAALSQIEKQFGKGAVMKLGAVQFSRSVVSDSLRPHESQHARPLCPSQTPRVHSDSRPLSQ